MSLINRSLAAGLALTVICVQSARAADPVFRRADRAKSDPAGSYRRAALKIDSAVRFVRELEVRPSGPGDFGQPYRYEYAGTVSVTVYENLTGVSLGVSSAESPLFVAGLPRSWRSGTVNMKPGTYKYEFTFKSHNRVTGYKVEMTTTPDFVRQVQIAEADFRVQGVPGRIKSRK